MKTRCEFYAGFFYVRYAVSYRGLQELMAERHAQVYHATLNSWIMPYSSDLAKTAQIKKTYNSGTLANG